MNQFIFKSRWIAIAFAVLTLFGAYVIVSGVGGGSEEAAQPDQEDAQIAQAGVAEPAPATEEQAMDDSDFVDDGELIDEAGGTDPTPDGGDDSEDSGDSGDDYGSSASSGDSLPQVAADGTPIAAANPS